MIIEYLFNKLIRLDPDCQQYLLQLHDKCIEIHCTDLNKKLWFIFDQDYVQLVLHTTRSIDTTIQGPLNGFVHIAIHKQQANLRSHNMKIFGDVFCAESFQKLFININIDWEEELSKYTNDAIAHKLCFYLQQFHNYQMESATSLAYMIKEYLQEEARILPTATEINVFLQEVDQLRFAVDRLKARIEEYENN